MYASTRNTAPEPQTAGLSPRGAAETDRPARRELHVAVGVIRDPGNRVLIARRPAHVHQGGLWEFPGGKLEAGESVEAALARELDEELDIRVRCSLPLLRVRHDYPEFPVALEVREVTAWEGEPCARHHQAFRWVETERLGDYAFPAANRPIVSAARLPNAYAILDPVTFEAADLARRFDHLVRRGVTLLQLRAKTLGEEDYRHAATLVMERAQKTSVRVLLNTAPELARELGAHGVHLTAARLMTLTTRPLGAAHWVAASCHDAAELHQAQRLGLDFVVLAPVLRTATHPPAAPLGWERFGELCREVSLPVYALGGLSLEDVALAREKGGRGIAAIRAFQEAA